MRDRRSGIRNSRCIDMFNPAVMEQHRRVGLTLVELIVVMAIMALLATVATVSLRGTVDRYHLSEAQQTIERFDAKARRAAQATGKPVVMRWNRSDGRVVLEEQVAPLPPGVGIESIKLGRLNLLGNQFEIPYHRSGACQTYAVELRRGAATRWLVVVGTSGQVVAVDQPGEVDALLSL